METPADDEAAWLSGRRGKRRRGGGGRQRREEVSTPPPPSSSPENETRRRSPAAETSSRRLFGTLRKIADEWEETERTGRRIADRLRSLHDRRDAARDTFTETSETALAVFAGLEEDATRTRGETEEDLARRLRVLTTQSLTIAEEAHAIVERLNKEAADVGAASAQDLREWSADLAAALAEAAGRRRRAAEEGAWPATDLSTISLIRTRLAIVLTN